MLVVVVMPDDDTEETQYLEIALQRILGKKVKEKGRRINGRNTYTLVILDLWQQIPS